MKTGGGNTAHIESPLQSHFKHCKGSCTLIPYLLVQCLSVSHNAAPVSVAVKDVALGTSSVELDQGTGHLSIARQKKKKVSKPKPSPRGKIFSVPQPI